MDNSVAIKITRGTKTISINVDKAGQQSQTESEEEQK